MFKKLLFLSSLLVVLFPLGDSFGYESRGQDCSKCHSLSKEEATNLLRGVIPDILVLDVKISAAKALWEVYSEVRGKKGLVYIDFSKNHLIMGTLISIKERKNLTQERLSELNKVDVSQIPLGDAIVMGDKEARIRVIAFHDPD